MPTDLLARTERQSRFHALKLGEAEALSRVHLATDALLGAIGFDMPRGALLDAASAVSDAQETLRAIQKTLLELAGEELESTLESVRGMGLL
jgi:hypothetical protein